MKIDEINICYACHRALHGNKNDFCLRLKICEKNMKNMRCEIATKGTLGAISVAKTQRRAHRTDIKYTEPPYMLACIGIRCINCGTNTACE